MTTTTTTPAHLSKLRKRLPRGYQTTAVKRLRRYSQSYVSMVANGTRANAAVMKMLCRIAEEHEAAQQELNARMAGKK